MRQRFALRVVCGLRSVWRRVGRLPNCRLGLFGSIFLTRLNPSQHARACQRSGFTVGVALIPLETLLGLGRVNTSWRRIGASMSLWWVCWAIWSAMVCRHVLSLGLAEIMRPFPTCRKEPCGTGFPSTVRSMCIRHPELASDRVVLAWSLVYGVLHQSTNPNTFRPTPEEQVRLQSHV